MSLCQASHKKPKFPKMMGQSSPRGHHMSLVDMGPDFADVTGRFVLTVDEEVTPFADEHSAISGWQDKFRIIVSEQENSISDLDYAAP